MGLFFMFLMFMKIKYFLFIENILINAMNEVNREN